MTDFTGLKNETIMTFLLHFQKLFPNLIKVYPMWESNCSVSFYAEPDLNDRIINHIHKNSKIKTGSYSF